MKFFEAHQTIKISNRTFHCNKGVSFVKKPLVVDKIYTRIEVHLLNLLLNPPPPSLSRSLCKAASPLELHH